MLNRRHDCCHWGAVTCEYQREICTTLMLYKTKFYLSYEGAGKMDRSHSFPIAKWQFGELHVIWLDNGKIYFHLHLCIRIENVLYEMSHVSVFSYMSGKFSTKLPISDRKKNGKIRMLTKICQKTFYWSNIKVLFTIYISAIPKSGAYAPLGKF